jgi:mersacidin/lichenicidin family type 2 lantibiotic
MTLADKLRAWREPAYRNTLSEAEITQLANPAGMIELSGTALDAVAGGWGKSRGGHGKGGHGKGGHGKGGHGKGGGRGGSSGSGRGSGSGGGHKGGGSS